MPDDAQGVAQTRKHAGGENRCIGFFAQARAEGEQVSGEVAAVHARHIMREEWLERAGIIPIVEVSAMPFELMHRGQGVLRAFYQTSDRQEAEIAGGQIGQQRQAHIGGRGA